jgi:integrase
MAKGRRKNGRNRGYFYRDGRGWFANVDGSYEPLEFENGGRMREQNVPLADVKAAYLRAISKLNEMPAEMDVAEAEPSGVTVHDVCDAYLKQVKDAGAPATFISRRNTLFDFCLGLPSRFIENGKPKPKPKRADYGHDGFGRLPVASLKPLHLDQWLQAHPTWKGGRRTRIQAVKRALNYGVESGMIAANPIKGYKTPKQRGRVTYLTPEQETALCETANSALATAIKVCIRTGARPGCEFAALTARHVTDHGNRMEWTFKPEESKTHNLRTIRISDPAIIDIVRQQLQQHKSGSLFRNTAGTPWTRENLTEKFRNLKNNLIKEGLEFDADACMYSCRHTYAKRVLQGYWSGKATNIETLAKLMGNSPQVCRDHYLQWCESYAEPLWESA